MADPSTHLSRALSLNRLAVEEFERFAVAVEAQRRSIIARNIEIARRKNALQQRLYSSFCGYLNSSQLHWIPTQQSISAILRNPQVSSACEGWVAANAPEDIQALKEYLSLEEIPITGALAQWDPGRIAEQRALLHDTTDALENALAEYEHGFNTP